MSEHNNDQITQKDLLKLLFDQAQHNATREEVQAVQEEIKETNKRFDGLVTREDLQVVDNKLNELSQNVATREDLKVEVQHLETSIQQLDSKIDSSIDSLRKEMKEDNQSLRTELKGDMKSLEKRLDAQIAKLDNRLWWIAGLIVALAFKSEIFALFQG